MADLARLAAHRLDAGQARKLSRAIARTLEDGGNLEPLGLYKLAILSSGTMDFVADQLPAAAARRGLALDLHVATAGLVEQEALHSESGTAAFGPDATLLALDAGWFGFDRLYSSAQEGEAAVAGALDRLDALLGAMQQSGMGTPILSTIAATPFPLFGSYDGSFAGSPRAAIASFNARLAELAQRHEAQVFDCAGLAAEVGLARWHDARSWHLYKLPFASEAVPLFCDRLAALLCAMRGRSRKCLVLDLDNTIWGGVIGDDGLEGIVVGAGNPVGEAHLALQRAALTLKERGIILAVSSKNEDATARRPFREHPDMLLSEDDIAVFQANWEEKSANLEAIAKALNIGLDALVFIDDNPAERAAVRDALPQVAVPELTADPSDFAPHLMAGAWFEAIAFSDEDRGRADSYRANARRVAVEAKARNPGDYLAALGMTVSHRPFDAIGRARIAQLVGKSNQFNLTTKRYSQSEIASLEDDPSVLTQQTRLADKFGDFGMIGVIIARILDGGKVIDIDSWLMSCRVLGRRVEESMLDDLVAVARDKGACRLAARYIPTSKNRMVADHFDKLGFRRIGENAQGGHEYQLDLEDYRSPSLPFSKG